MSIINIDGIPTTFVTKGATFSNANNIDSVDHIGTTNRYLNLLSDFDGEGGSWSGQQLWCDGNYYIYQALLRFNIPLARIKRVNSARLNFAADKYTTEQSYSSSDFRIRMVDAIKRFVPSDSASAPLLGNFSNNSHNNILIPNASNYIKDYKLNLLFSEVAQETVTQLISAPDLEKTGYEYSLEGTRFGTVTLRLDVEEYTQAQLDGFKHFELHGSGFVESLGSGEYSLYVQNSGFLYKGVPEESGSIVLYPGSGHQLKEWQIVCEERALVLPENSDSYQKEIEIEIPEGHRGQGYIRIYRWNSPPDNSSYDFDQIIILDGAGLISLPVEPEKRWFHFTQTDPDQGEMPLRIRDYGGKLLVVGF